MHPRPRRLARIASIAFAAFATLVPGPAAAQTPPPPILMHAVDVDSGVHANATPLEKMVWQQPVQIGNAPWLKLRFEGASLPGGSRIEITSFEDGHCQRIDRRAMRDWFPHSAYFNGDAVLVRLFAGPFTRDVSVAIDAVETGLPPVAVDSMCGPDDRKLSHDPRSGRLMPAGCTAWIGTRHGLIFTAGHCSGRLAQIVQFNVPLSTPSGTKRNPPPQDQFPLVAVLGGLSNPNACDWAIYIAGKNGSQETPLSHQGSFFRLAPRMPPLQSTLRITGYGVAQGTWNQAQKTTIGPFVGMGQGRCGPYLVRYHVDSISGDSGSPVIDEASGAVIAVHSGGDCGGTIGANQGSAITNADIQRVLQNPNPMPPGPIAHGDLILSHAGFQLPTRLAQIDARYGSLGTFFSGGSGFVGLTMAPNNDDFVVLDATSQDTLIQVTPAGSATTIANLGAAQSPTAVELDQDGSFIVSSTDNHIRRVTPGGTVTTMISLPVRIFERTNDIARDHDTGYFVAGVWQTGQLYELDLVNGTIVRTITNSTNAFYGVDIEPRTGNYVVISYSTPQVRVYDRQGTVIRSWSFPFLTGIEIDDQTGNYYCVGSGHVLEFTPTGTIAKQWGPYAGFTFNAVDEYGSKQVTGVGSALPGSSYGVNFKFHGMAGASYLAALSFAQRPGIALAGGRLNLAPDSLFAASLGGVRVRGFAGRLDANGRGSGTIAIPAALKRGTTFFCSAIAVQGSALQLGNTVGITVR